MAELAHLVFNGPTASLKMYWEHDDGTVELRHELEAHGEAIRNATDGDPYGFDCKAPPGDFGLGDPQSCATRNPDGTVTIHNSTPPTWDKAYGCWFTPLVDTNGLEAAHGRAGIAFHGGGSDAPDPFALKQGWYVTEGCIRLQNVDNEQTFVPFVQYMKANVIPILVTIAW
jgi:hypothetical protein